MICYAYIHIKLAPSTLGVWSMEGQFRVSGIHNSSHAVRCTSGVMHV